MPIPLVLGYLGKLGPRLIQRALLVAALFATFILYYVFSDIANSKVTDTLVGVYSKSLVISSVKSEHTGWIGEHLRSWRSNIYVVDANEEEEKEKGEISTSLKVPANRGRESMVYLTYIIDNYETLPDIMLFTHGLRYQWHNDDPLYDNVPVINNLRLSFVKQVGFTPLRCTWVPGCPDELHPLNPTGGIDGRQLTEKYYASAYNELFPNSSVPETVGAPCSAQFAASRDKIRQRPKENYEHYRKWLLETPLQDEISGRIMEYMWHIIMGMPPVFCPPAGECFCMAFGLCDLTCPNAAKCENRYILPKYAQLPPKWPESGGGENGWPDREWFQNQ